MPPAQAQPLAHARKETPLIEPVRWPRQRQATGGEIDGRRYRDHAGEQALRVGFQFAGELQHLVAAERKAGQKYRCPALPVKIRQDGEKILREAGVVERRAHELRAAATANVRPVDGEACLQQNLRHAQHVGRQRGTFEAVHQHHLAPRILRALRMNEHLHVGFRVKQPRLHRIAPAVEFAGPQHGRNRRQMRISKNRAERRERIAQDSMVAAGPTRRPRRRCSNRLQGPSPPPAATETAAASNR